MVLTTRSQSSVFLVLEKIKKNMSIFGGAKAAQVSHELSPTSSETASSHRYPNMATPGSSDRRTRPDAMPRDRRRPARLGILVTGASGAPERSAIVDR